MLASRYATNHWNIECRCIKRLNLLKGYQSFRAHPSIFLGLTTDWPAHTNWTREKLIRSYGDAWFQCGWNLSQSEPHIAKLKDVVNSSHSNNGLEPLYVFDATFDFDCPDLLKDYNIPSVFANEDKFSSFPEHRRPKDLKWFLVGGKGTGSKLHRDPALTSAWNALIKGTKEWYILSPDFAKLIALKSWFRDDISIDGHFDVEIPNSLIYLNQRFSLLSPEQVNKLIVYKFLQKPGETVYIPAGWYHAVRNVNFTVAVTHNFLEYY